MMKAGLMNMMVATASEVSSDRQLSYAAVQSSVLHLADACKHLLELPAFAHVTSDQDARAVRTARAALAAGDDVSVRMGVRVLLHAPVLAAADLDAAEQLVVASAQRAVTSFQQLSLRLLEVALVHEDAEALDDAITERDHAGATRILGRYPGILDVASPLSLSNLQTLHLMARDRRGDALAYAVRQCEELVEGCQGVGAGTSTWCGVPRRQRRFGWTPATTIGEVHDAVSFVVAAEFPDLEPVTLSAEIRDDCARRRAQLVRDLVADFAIVSCVQRMASGRHLIRVDVIDVSGGTAHRGLLQINTGLCRDRSTEVANHLAGFLGEFGP